MKDPGVRPCASLAWALLAMPRRTLAGVVLFAALSGVPPPVIAEPSEATSKRALIVFDVANDRHLAEGYARQLKSLLGHFALSAIDVTSTAGYARGDVDRHDVLFFIGSGRALPLPAEVLEEVWSDGKRQGGRTHGLVSLVSGYSS